MNDVFLVSISTAVIYFFLLAAVIFFGKKELSQISIIDLIFILLISNSVQNAMVNADARSLELGIVSALTLFILNAIMKFAMFKSVAFNKLVEGEPVVLIYRGRLMEKNLGKQKIGQDEIKAAMREHGVEKVEDVSLAMLENDGNISVVSFDQKDQTIFKRKKKVPVKLE